jgi:DNA-binding IclR family transcriptional regulator
MKRPTMQVLAKATRILECLADEPELTVAQLAEALGGPRSTVYRLVANLEQLDFVEPGSQRGTYRLTTKVFRLGSSVLSRFDERQLAMPVMKEIHGATAETVYLCVRRGNEAVCIERIDGLLVKSMALLLGGSLPLHVGAAPRALLAFEPRELWDEYSRSMDLVAYTEKTPTTRHELFALLEEIRATGYAISNEDVTTGIASLGAPVFDHTGAPRAALSISGPVAKILGDRFVALTELICAGAEKVSSGLGYNPDAAIGQSAADGAGHSSGDGLPARTRPRAKKRRAQG